jgi:outer membrane protein TolC
MTIQRLPFLLLVVWLIPPMQALNAEDRSPTSGSTNKVFLIDLPAALQLAGAQNLDIQIARERVAEAKANYESSVLQFFPWIGPGVSYRRHDNLIQDVGGSVIEVHKEAYTIGPSVAGQLDLGEAIYRNLASRQSVKASSHALEAQRDDAILDAAQGYFDLAKARAAKGVAVDAVSISSNYASQVEQAVEAGIAFKGDLLRVRVQTERNLLILRQAEEQQRLAAAHLAQTLHLDSTLELVPRDAEPVPVVVVDTNATLDSLVIQAVRTRPELKQSRALIDAARKTRQGTVYGPLIPTLGAQIFAGGLGGGRDGAPGTFGESEDYQLTIGWRVGPGGLFDQGRIHASESRLRIARLTEQKLLDEVTRQVIDGLTRTQSLHDQMATAQRAIQAAEEALRLTEQRKEFAVGAVLESIQAEQELTRARLDFLNAVAEHNKAQYALRKAIGGSVGDRK